MLLLDGRAYKFSPSSQHNVKIKDGAATESDLEGLSVSTRLIKVLESAIGLYTNMACLELTHFNNLVKNSPECLSRNKSSITNFMKSEGVSDDTVLRAFFEGYDRNDFSLNTFAVESNANFFRRFLLGGMTRTRKRMGGGSIAGSGGCGIR
jgi:hypothetical protein